MTSGPAQAASGKLRREFTFRSTFALAFAFISPIIGLYTIFALSIQSAGPSFWLGFAIVLAGQFLVALILAELASVWPRAGGLYRWTAALAGERIGWWAGWAYMWTLIVLVTAQCYAAAPFIAGIFTDAAPAKGTLLLLAFGMLVVATAVNWLGPKALKVFVALSITAELVGSLVIGTILLLFFREQSFSAVFDGPDLNGTTLAPMLAAVALIGWSFIGFESAGDIAEEVEQPEKQVPRALVLSLVVVALIVMYAALGLILAIPDLPAAISGQTADPISATVTAQIGSGIAKPLFVLVTLAFVAGIAAVQASVSRVIYALAQDRAIPASGMLGQLSGADELPRNAIAVSSVVAGALLFIALSDDAYLTLISMATVGFYLSFAFPTFAVLWARIGGRFTPGVWNIGRYGLVVNVIASLWLAFEIVNIAWPRIPDSPWFVNYGAILMVAVVALLGLVTRGGMAAAKGAAPAIEAA